MLVQPKRGVVPAVGVVLVLIFFVSVFSGRELLSRQTTSVRQWTSDRLGSLHTQPKDVQEVYSDKPSYKSQRPKPVVTTTAVAHTHNEIFSNITEDGRYFPVKFGNYAAMNPNIIPHPSLNDTWYIVAQRFKNGTANPAWFTELVCEATFQNGVLRCAESPLNLPIPGTFSLHCEGDLSYFNFNIGPHDARVFYGPDRPYVIYGSQSTHNCFGQWMQDFRPLTEWVYHGGVKEPFRVPTDLQRPPPYGPIEKNWFVFWDADGEIYAHYDISPRRVFAKLGFDGTVGEDLAPFARTSDDTCLNEYMPLPDPDLPESIHQATNSLSVTLCKRSDPTCKVTDDNTFLFTIVQRKSYYDYHSTYEPYVVLFRQRAPFQVYGVSSKPIWINGRKTTIDGSSPPTSSEESTSRAQSEMLYVTSMSWMARGQRYHGYMDDTLFVGFGIEDAASGGIDVVAADLLAGLGLCSDL